MNVVEIRDTYNNSIGLTGGEEVVDTVLNVLSRDVEAAGDDTALVDTADELNEDRS